MSSAPSDDLKAALDRLADLTAVTYALLAQTTAPAYTVARAEKELIACQELLQRLRPSPRLWIGDGWKQER